MAPGDKTLRWPEESTRVDIHRDDELTFWCKCFRVSPGMLRQAIERVGQKFKDVSAFLEAKRHA